MLESKLVCGEKEKKLPTSTCLRDKSGLSENLELKTFELGAVLPIKSFLNSRILSLHPYASMCC